MPLRGHSQNYASATYPNKGSCACATSIHISQQCSRRYPVSRNDQASITCINDPRTSTVDACDGLPTAFLAGSPALEALHMHIVTTLLAKGDLVLWSLTISLGAGTAVSVCSTLGHALSSAIQLPICYIRTDAPTQNKLLQLSA